MKLNRYDINFNLVKGEDYSRHIKQSDCRRILSVCMDPDISGVRLEEIRKTTEEYSELQFLITNITGQWPERKNLQNIQPDISMTYVKFLVFIKALL